MELCGPDKRKINTQLLTYSQKVNNTFTQYACPKNDHNGKPSSKAKCMYLGHWIKYTNFHTLIHNPSKNLHTRFAIWAILGNLHTLFSIWAFLGKVPSWSKVYVVFTQAGNFNGDTCLEFQWWHFLGISMVTLLHTQIILLRLLQIVLHIFNNFDKKCWF